MPHGGRTLLLHAANVHALTAEEADAAEAGRLAAEAAAEAAQRATEAKAEAEAAARRAAQCERQAKFEAADAALDSYIGGLPISPAGYFNSRDRLLECVTGRVRTRQGALLTTRALARLRRWHEYGEPPPDCASSTEDWQLACACVCWRDETTAFCCVGAPHYCNGGRLPHNVPASSTQRQRALLHLVKSTHSGSSGHTVHVYVERQCAACAHSLLEAGCPLHIVLIAAFCDERRALCRAAAAQCIEPRRRARCADCEAPLGRTAGDGNDHCPWCKSFG